MYHQIMHILMPSVLLELRVAAAEEGPVYLALMSVENYTTSEIARCHPCTSAVEANLLKSRQCISLCEYVCKPEGYVLTHKSQ